MIKENLLDLKNSSISLYLIVKSTYIFHDPGDCTAVFETKHQKFLHQFHLFNIFKTSRNMISWMSSQPN